jgi:hypothetical protein
MADQLLKGLTKGQMGGMVVNGVEVPDDDDEVTMPRVGDDPESADTQGGRRRRNSKHHKGNSWLAHVKATMKDKKNKGKSFKQVLKLAKKTYKKSQSLSGGRKKRKSLKNKGEGMFGGSGNASASTFGSTAGAYPNK